MSTPMKHVPTRLLERYAAGETGGADVWWAVEAHLEACPQCAERLADVVGRASPATAALLDQTWASLATQVATRAAERRGGLMRRASKRIRRWRLRWVRRWVTPALVPRLAMTALVVLTALGLDVADGVAGRYPSVVLLVAPIAPLLGVATAWARGLDPAYELVVASPRAGLDLVLRRTVVVLAVVIPMLVLVGWKAGTSPALWLLPCLACTAGALALGEVIGLHRAATGLAAAWVVLAVGPSLVLGRPSVLLAAAALPAWAVLIVVLVAVLLVRRKGYTALTSAS